MSSFLPFCTEDMHPMQKTIPDKVTDFHEYDSSTKGFQSKRTKCVMSATVIV